MSIFIYAILFTQNLQKKIELWQKTRIKTQIMYLQSGFMIDFTLIFKLNKVKSDLLKVNT